MAESIHQKQLEPGLVVEQGLVAQEVHDQAPPTADMDQIALQRN